MAEINIRDLSIGDWVKASGVAKRVHSIDFQNGEYFVHFSDPDTNSEDYLHAPFVKPIPLTPEILEKNGISKTYESDEYAVYKGEGFNVTEYYTELWEFERHRNRLMIRNVHQLQHALRLAGVEKEIEL